MCLSVPVAVFCVHEPRAHEVISRHNTSRAGPSACGVVHEPRAHEVISRPYLSPCLR